MKKYLLILFLVFALVLCACGNTASAPDATVPAETEEQTEPTSEVVEEEKPAPPLAVHITINPELTLYLDEGQTILSAEAGNEDGQTILSQLDLVGKIYTEGMNVLLNTAYDMGYLKEDGQVSIQVDGVAVTHELLEALSVPIETFKEEKAVAADCDIELQAETIEENPEESIVIDGQKVYIITKEYSDGILQIYTTKEEYYDKTGYIKDIWEGNNGVHTVTYYKNGNPTKTVTTGTRQALILYNSDGTRKSDWFVWENGAESKRTFYAHEVLATEYQKQPDGFSEYTTYNSAGIKTSEEMKAPDGYGSRVTYYESGATKSAKVKMSDGFCYEAKYNSDGSYQYYEDNADGGRQFYFSGGKLTKAIVAGKTYTSDEDLRGFEALL